MGRNRTIAILGPYSGRGYWVLCYLRDYLRALGFPVYLAADQFPAQDPTDPASVRCATARFLRNNRGFLFVLLSEKTLGTSGVDIVGAVAWEYGIVYGDWMSGAPVAAALLFDGLEHHAGLTKLLQLSPIDPTIGAILVHPGDLQALCDHAVALCLLLVQRI